MRFRQALAAAAFVAALAAPTASAGDPEPPEPPDEPVVAADVTIAGAAVGGLGWDEARTAVRASFDRPLTFRFHRHGWQVLPRRLGAVPYVRAAVRLALAAEPGTEIPLFVRIDRRRIARYAAYLDRIYSRPATDSELLLRGLRPYITKPKPGVDIRTTKMRSLIGLALRLSDRRRIRLRVKLVPPRVTPQSFGPIIVIRRESKRLYLYRGMRFVRRFGVATGQPSYPTPLGRYTIVIRERNPWWNPPDSDWARGAAPIPPGPGNPLGTRWMGLSASGIGIHGTPDAASIGYSASHGCIRMRIPDAEWVFERVRIGTPVFIVGA